MGEREGLLLNLHMMLAIALQAIFLYMPDVIVQRQSKLTYLLDNAEDINHLHHSLQSFLWKWGFKSKAIVVPSKCIQNRVSVAAEQNKGIL